ncbi:MAG TPA: HEAT repeat domain-containing protein [Planctomycetota bacterium]
MLIPSLVIALLAQGRTVDNSSAAELRFHRVHLRNGNFIDGDLVRQNAKEIVLRLKSGEMGVRRDQIVRVEMIKMRGIQDKPEEVTQPKPPPISFETPTTPGSPRKTPAAQPRPLAEGAYKASPALKAQVDPVLESLRTAAPDEINALIQRLVDMEPEAHAYLASQLEVAPPTLVPLIGSVLSRTASTAAAPYLTRLLAHESPLVRMQAVVGLATNGEASDAGALTRVLKDKDPGVRGAAVTTLGAIGEAAAFDAIAPLCSDPDAETRGRALSTLAVLAKKYELKEELVKTLIDALNGAPESRALDVIGALAVTKDEQACPAIAAHLGSDRADVRAAAAAALGTIGSASSADDIEDRVGKEEDLKVRLALAEAAVKVKAAGAMAGIAAWLDDESELLKSAAHRALKALSGTDVGLDREKWDEWIEINGKK